MKIWGTFLPALPPVADIILEKLLDLETWSNSPCPFADWLKAPNLQNLTRLNFFPEYPCIGMKSSSKCICEKNLSSFLEMKFFVTSLMLNFQSGTTVFSPSYPRQGDSFSKRKLELALCATV